MNFKIAFLAFFLGNFVINAQSVDCRFVPVDNMCETGQYCVNIEVSSDDGADLVGSSSIRFAYDDTVLSFFGESNDGVTIGSYTSLTFDDDQTSLYPSCTELGGTPYSPHGFDGKISGEFILTWVLLQQTLFGTPSACPAINEGEWIKTNEICFDVLDPDADPNFVFSGTENGVVTDIGGTNFNADDVNPIKYQNGSFESLHTSFSELCEGVEPVVTDTSMEEDNTEEPALEEVNNSSVDCRFAPVENTCETGQYCINIEVSSDDGADLLGNSNINFFYDPNVLTFQGSSIEGVSIGSYSSVNFDADQTSLCASCAELGATPYDEHDFGAATNKFGVSFTLLEPTLFGTPVACPPINKGEWIKVNEICFEVIDPDGNPNFVFSENASELPSSSFMSHNNTTKYQNGSFENLHTPFSKLCGNDLVAANNEALCDQISGALNSRRVGSGVGGVGKTALENIEIQISPIPTKDIVTVTYQGTTTENMTLHIYDITGKLIIQKEYISDEGRNRLSIDLSREATGLYLLQLNNGTERITKNIMKE